jgi:hypothetical protein
MKTYGEVDAQIHVLLTSALVGGERSASHPGSFTLRERTSGTLWIRGCVGPSVNLDEAEKRKISALPGHKL